MAFIPHLDSSVPPSLAHCCHLHPLSAAHPFDGVAPLPSLTGGDSASFDEMHLRSSLRRGAVSKQNIVLSADSHAIAPDETLLGYDHRFSRLKRRCGQDLKLGYAGCL